MIKAEIIADSISPSGNRITSFLLEFPRFILAEVNTHRMLSKNAASSRAIPTEKMIQQVIDNPAMPVWWGKNQSGMQAKEELSPEAIELAKRNWLNARDSAIEYVRKGLEIGLHKQILNRCIEPWFNIRIILTGTDFQNFFALRAHPDAQPEFQALAYKMLEEYNKSVPNPVEHYQWHIPFGDSFDEVRLKALHDSLYEPGGELERERINMLKVKIAVARCARVSYFNFEGKDDYIKDLETCDKLFGSVPRHLSPAEHVAFCAREDEYYGNFRGWIQYRKMFSDENLSDSRVLTK